MNVETQTGVLSWFKWWVSDANTCKATLTNEQMGELFYAVMAYVEKPDKIVVSPAIQFPYSMFCEKVDAARKAYKCQSEKRAEAGRKGGKAKAENAKSASTSAPTSYKPPTKTEYKALIKHLRKSQKIQVDDYEASEFYDDLKSFNWTINGVPIGSTKQIEAAIIAKFNYEHHIDELSDWFLFRLAFEAFSGDVDDETVETAINACEHGGIDLLSQSKGLFALKSEIYAALRKFDES